MSDFELMGKVIHDINTGRGTEGYTDEMRAFRESAERQLARARKYNPSAYLSMPVGLEGLPG
jgi:hypothetical protein